MSGDEFTAFMAGIAMIAIIFGLLAYVVGSYLLSRIFRKAGLDQWKAWVPVYNNWKTYELGGQQGWWAILMFVPVVNVAAAVFFYIAAYNIGLKLQKEGWFVILAIFLPIVWLAWLAFDKSTWNGAVSTAVDMGAGEPPMPAGMAAAPAPQASPAEAAPSDATVAPVEPALDQAPDQPVETPTVPNPTEPQPMAGSDVTAKPSVETPTVDPAPNVEPVAPTAPTVEPTAPAPEANQPAVEYPSVDGILSPTDPATPATTADEQVPTEPQSATDQSQPPQPPTQQ